MLRRLRQRLVYLKDNNALLKLIWLKYMLVRGKCEIERYSDRESIDRIYYRYSGRYPDMDSPRLFSEKMQWLKLNYRNDKMPVCADKYAVRDYIVQQGYPELLNELLAVYDADNISEFDPKKLPDKFVLKAAHGSGWNLVVADKGKINWFWYKKIIRNWLKQSIFWNGREWSYQSIEPRIVCEKYLEDSSGELRDYKFYCFHGEPKFLQVNQGRSSMVPVQNFYSLDWELLPFGKSIPHNPHVTIDKPEQFDKMVDIARNLSAPFPYVRVDLYFSNDKIYFGELTFFPASGMPDFILAEYDEIVGGMLSLPHETL